MPPRAVKKAAGPGTKRIARTRGTPKAQAEESAKVEEVNNFAKEEVKMEEANDAVDVEEVVKVEEIVEKKIEETPVENKIEPAKSKCHPFLKEDEEVKESVEEFEKGERLDLDDNDPEEYEAEEYGGVDYDDKELEQDDDQEEVDDLEEEVEDGDALEEEVGDLAEDDMEDAPEEIEGEEAHVHAAEEHAVIGDAEDVEHHDVVSERRKRKEFEVFVGGLDKDANEDDLRKVFRQVGEVVEVRLMMNPQTKKNKGFAFIRYSTVEQAKKACAELKNPVINGKQCGVTPSQDSDTLFLGNVCKSWTKEALKDKLKHYGIETEDLTLVEDPSNEGMNRGFAFLEFASRSDAMDAFKRLQRRDVKFGVDRPAKVSFADSFIDPGDEIMAQVRTVFVDGLPASWDEDRVRELLKKYGEVEKIELARNMPSAKRKDFGFVTFGTHDAALTCAKSINNEELGEGENKAKVRARLSRPLQRGKGKHAPRGVIRPLRAAPTAYRSPWGRPVPRSLPVRGVRRVGGRPPPPPPPPAVNRVSRRPVGFRERRLVAAVPPRGRPVPPVSRSHDRRPPPVPSYPKSLKRDYGRREELPPRSRAAANYAPPRAAAERRSSYRDDYPPPPRGSAYADLPRGASHASARRSYDDDGYGQRFARPPPSYREGRPRDFDSISGSKRPYSALDDVPPRYAEAGVRPRARLDYEPSGGGASHYGDAYSDRLGRSNMGYSGSRGSISGQDSHGLYSSRQGMDYGGGSYSGGEVGGMYSSRYGSEYVSRGGNVGGSSYSSIYSGRSLGGSGYMSSGGSGSYY